ncbi:MAG: hypothetical protein AMXMBFR6_17150 [Betaproteobacteria bacterium]|nr:regulatory protein RecX [Rhodocyclaceae bacterium]MCG3186470.1 Regulatory protein RecX [Rhodocyclaceae bacterium]
MTRALAALARRDHARAELARKLAPHGECAEIEVVLERLQAEGYLSDRRFAQSFIEARQSGYGPRYLRHQLEARGVDRDVVEEALTSASEDEGTRLADLWRRRFGAPASSPTEWSRQYRYLVRHGFDAALVRRLLRNRETGQ